MKTHGVFPVDTTLSPYARLKTIPGGVRLTGGFWGRWQAVNRQAGIPHGYRMLEKAGNFYDLKLAAGLINGPYRHLRWMDSDVYKWLEAVAYELASGADEEMGRMAEETIAILAKAQAPDGYLNSHYQIVEPERRWTWLEGSHELYCAGHLTQAAVAHYRATGKTNLLDIARRFADHIDGVFGPGKQRGTPGHPEIEMAFVELYRVTRDPRYLRLVGYFLDERGHHLITGRAEVLDHVQVRQAREVAGHAVRQMYLLAGMTDVYLETGEQAMMDACQRLWDDMAYRKLYITGGVGSRHDGEAFGAPYELPNDRAYCETCAAIGSIQWNWRMLLATGERRFADLIERTLYNGFLSGVSLDGTHYFYNNPLLSQTGARRGEWHYCACCPPNVLRLISSLGHYCVTRDDKGVQVHQYVEGVVETSQATLRMETDYPWRGEIAITVESSTPATWTLSLRLPEWCDAPSLSVNDQPVDLGDTTGYATIERAWQQGERVTLHLPMIGRLTAAHPRIDATRGSLAIERGPLVYCIEQCDQEPGVDVLDVYINETAPLSETWEEDLLGGVITVDAAGFAESSSLWASLYYPFTSLPGGPRQEVRLRAIPYYAWANREQGAMRVWIPRSSGS